MTYRVRLTPGHPMTLQSPRVSDVRVRACPAAPRLLRWPRLRLGRPRYRYLRCWSTTIWSFIAQRSVHLAGLAVHLPKSEFDILHTFLVSDGRAFTLADLAAAIDQSTSHKGLAKGTGRARAVQVHIGNLRKKLADDPGNPRWIMTLRGVGYRLALNSADQ